MQLPGDQNVHENFDTAYRMYGTRLQKLLGNFTLESSMIATILDKAIMLAITIIFPTCKKSIASSPAQLLERKTVQIQTNNRMNFHLGPYLG